MIRRISTVGTVLLLAGSVLLTGCGEDLETPAMPKVSLPTGMPEIPSELPDAKVDPEQAKQLVCQAGNAWVTADGTQRKLVEPALRKLTGHYMRSSDEAVKNAAVAADALLTAREAGKDAAIATFHKACGETGN